MKSLRSSIALAVSLAAVSCGSASTGGGAPNAPTAANATEPSAAPAPSPPPSTSPPSELADGAPVAFRADFSSSEIGMPWNVFGAAKGNREAHGGPDGLSLKILDAEKEWDAVGARTAKVKVDGDFDLRARFRDFSATGDGSAKLIVVDAARPRGEAAYVERIQIDGKSLFKFGGEVEGSIEDWGFVATDAKGGDLRLVRAGGMLHAYTRPDERASWTEFARPMAVPKSMPRVLKVGFKLSAGAHKSASVRWADLTLNGQVLRTE